MPTFSLFDKADENSRYFRSIVLSLRKQSLEEGVDPTDFPEWLAAQGVEAFGPLIHIDDKLVTFETLKNQKL